MTERLPMSDALFTPIPTRWVGPLLLSGDS